MSWQKKHNKGDTELASAAYDLRSAEFFQSGGNMRWDYCDGLLIGGWLTGIQARREQRRVRKDTEHQTGESMVPRRIWPRLIGSWDSASSVKFGSGENLAEVLLIICRHAVCRASTLSKAEGIQSCSEEPGQQESGRAGTRSTASRCIIKILMEAVNPYSLSDRWAVVNGRRACRPSALDLRLNLVTDHCDAEDNEYYARA
ncbi:hypothetical protein BS47DRAFT_1464660 [Hydnum rufescens UP504]|uniref:Uncharacterized protein n=1 Tax=Hydnum rufescens UP504 TaxID=1448309 RepID=A0A9P6DRP5_9AGAM|nr:hypothetical protein BS47DRAFT_1464660 [Hydnum rufescens UP504]